MGAEDRLGRTRVGAGLASRGWLTRCGRLVRLDVVALRLGWLTRCGWADRLELLALRRGWLARAGWVDRLELLALRRGWLNRMGARCADELRDGVCAFLLGVAVADGRSVVPVRDETLPDREGVALRRAVVALGALDVPERTPLEGGICKDVAVRRPVTSPDRCDALVVPLRLEAFVLDGGD
jgi:hypothetical protein